MMCYDFLVLQIWVALLNQSTLLNLEGGHVQVPKEIVKSFSKIQSEMFGEVRLMDVVSHRF